MKIVVDTNIIFSALLNSTGTIGDLIFNSDKDFEFYSCIYMKHEIDKHWNKLKSISKLTDIQLQVARSELFKKINFINEELISEKQWLSAERIVKDIDIDDLDFVALSNFIKGYLWTGDKPLYNGLKEKNYKKVLNTKELEELRKGKS
ncbi:MAG TPA: nucleotide-binding protein [Prolixibacteraceae bacterium]|nr:nucleotide-binding protein [Prolixibacteraceae bacterium]